MKANELAMESPDESKTRRRVVEAEIKLPRLEELEMPKIDLEPVRALMEQVLLTGIGVGVLLVRGVTSAVKAANQAGVEASESPGPVIKALLGLVRREGEPGEAGCSEAIVKVPVLPIDNYDELSAEEITGHFSELSADQLGLLRHYEADHQARDEVLEEIDRLLETG